MNGLTEQLAPLLENVLTGVLSLAGAYVVLYMHKLTARVKAETELVKNEDRRKMMQAALMRLDEVTDITVDSIEQTTARALREAVKAGSADRKQLEYLAIEARREIVAALEPEYLKVLNDTLGDINIYLGNLVEAKVKAIKEAA